MGLRLIRAIKSFRPTTKPACGPPNNLSPENVTRSAPSATASAAVGSLNKTVRGEIDERSRPEIVDERHPSLARDRSERARGDLGGKTLDAVIRSVDLKDKSGFRPDSSRIILRMCPVGGADLDQLGPGARHDFRQAECAADLDQLATRYNRLPPTADRVEHEQHRSGVVVHDRCVFRPRELAKMAANEGIAFAALAAAEVEFERNRVAHRGRRRRNGRIGQQSASKVRMKDCSRKIENGPDVGASHRLRAARRRCSQRRQSPRCSAGRQAAPPSQSRSPHAEPSLPRVFRTARWPMPISSVFSTSSTDGISRRLELSVIAAPGHDRPAQERRTDVGF